MALRRWRRRRALVFVGTLYMMLLFLYGTLHIVMTIRQNSRADDTELTPLPLANDPPIVTEVELPTPRELRRVTEMSELHDGGRYRLRLCNGDGVLWLGQKSILRPMEERSVVFERGRGANLYAIRAWSGLYLSAHPDDSVGFDRLLARSAEMWELRQTDTNDSVVLWSASRRHFVHLRKGELRCEAKDLSRAAKWEVFTEIHPPTRAPHQPSQLNASRGWMVLFGTAKPLKTLAPTDPDDPHDPFVIANRTLVNWSLINGVRPVVLTTDPLCRQLIEQINHQNTARGVGQQIDVITDFEIGKNFDLPTYRGLFMSVLRAYPDAEGFMYSNMDILYSYSTVETLRSVREYHNFMLKKGTFTKGGWFVVGRRINVVVPARWALDSGWERDVEGTFRKEGVPFQSLSEDYFALSRDMFDWNTIPDFIVGGTAFDNWVTAKAVRLAREGKAITVEGTVTLSAIHQNHGENVKASHQHPKSRYNNKLAQQNGGWSLGRTTDAPFMTLRLDDGTVTVVHKLATLLE